MSCFVSSSHPRHYCRAFIFRLSKLHFFWKQQKNCSKTQVRTDCTASLLTILLNTLPTAIGPMPLSFLRRAVNEEANSAPRDQYERFQFKIWFARQDIELRRRYPGSFASMLTRSRIWPGRSPSNPPLLLSVKDLMAARTDSGVAHNGEHWSGKGAILVSTGAGGSLERSTSATSSVRSAAESEDATSRNVVEMSPAIS